MARVINFLFNFQKILHALITFTCPLIQCIAIVLTKQLMRDIEYKQKKYRLRHFLIIYSPPLKILIIECHFEHCIYSSRIQQCIKTLIGPMH